MGEYSVYTNYEVQKIIAIGNRILITNLDKNIGVWTREGKCEATLLYDHKDIKLLPNHQLVIISNDGFVI